MFKLLSKTLFTQRTESVPSSFQNELFGLNTEQGYFYKHFLLFEFKNVFI